MATQDTSSESTSVEERLAKSAKLRIKEAIDPYLDLQIEGFERVDRLLHVADQISKSGVRDILEGPSEEDASQDILRAAVVLIHAQLEEFLRTMARVFLPEAAEACLNEIPLAGLGGRKEKFLLGKLVQHKGKLVDDLLKESVSEYLERSNYNSIEEISNLLQALGFNVTDHKGQFAAIQQMIERRHQIVHRADRFESANSLAALQPIKSDDVSNWLHEIQEFMQSLYVPILRKLLPIDFKTSGEATTAK